MLDNVNHISGVWGTRRGSVTQSLFFFFFPLLPVHMTRCQMRVSAFRLYIYIPPTSSHTHTHTHTHTHMLQDIYACAHPRTYILMKHKTLFQVTFSTRALILLYSLNPENLILKCITLQHENKPQKTQITWQLCLLVVPLFLFWNRPRVSKAFVFKSRCNKKSCLGATEKKWQYTCCCVMWHSKKAYWETDG